MNGRMQLALTVLMALMGTSLAGCLEAPSFLSTSDGEITAMEKRDLAESAALAWNPDAKLALVMTLETDNATDEEIPEDPSPGNGRALAWWYTFLAGNESRTWRVDASGNVTADEAEQVDEYDDELGVLKDWQVDSDAAIAAAAENETFRDALSGDGVFIAEGVTEMDGMTGWYLGVSSSKGLVFATVDATTGELMMVEAVSFDFEIPTWSPGAAQSEPGVEIEDEGTLDGDERTAEYSFTLASGGQEAELEIEIEKALPTDGLAWYLLDEEGEEVEGGSFGWNSGRSDSMEASFTIDEPGEYTLVLEYTGRTVVELGEVDYVLEFEVGGFDWDWDWDWSAAAAS